MLSASSVNQTHLRPLGSGNLGEGWFSGGKSLHIPTSEESVGLTKSIESCVEQVNPSLTLGLWDRRGTVEWGLKAYPTCNEAGDLAG